MALLGPDGPFASVIPGFEHRPQQVEMLQAVARAFNEESHLLAEAGTGVGKSLAYLLPALLFAYRTGRRVVVSTNTINLQEQLLQKDLPALIGMLEQTGLVPENEVRVAALKGRSNYLCVMRHGHLSRSDNLTPDEARLLSKSLVWLQDTATGDRAEINLAGRDGTLWHRISAGDRGDCPGIGSRDGPMLSQGRPGGRRLCPCGGSEPFPTSLGLGPRRERPPRIPAPHRRRGAPP